MRLGRGSLLFTKPVTAVTANYHGLIHGVFAYAVKRGYLAANSAIGTAPKQSRVKQSRPELRFLTERESLLRWCTTTTRA